MAWWAVYKGVKEKGGFLGVGKPGGFGGVFCSGLWYLHVAGVLILILPPVIWTGDAWGIGRRRTYKRCGEFTELPSSFSKMSFVSKMLEFVFPCGAHCLLACNLYTSERHSCGTGKQERPEFRNSIIRSQIVKNCSMKSIKSVLIGSTPWRKIMRRLPYTEKLMASETNVTLENGGSPLVGANLRQIGVGCIAYHRKDEILAKLTKARQEKSQVGTKLINLYSVT